MKYLSLILLLFLTACSSTIWNLEYNPMTPEESLAVDNHVRAILNIQNSKLSGNDQNNYARVVYEEAKTIYCKPRLFEYHYAGFFETGSYYTGNYKELEKK